MPKRVSPEEFLNRARSLWGDRWSYSKTMFEKMKKEVTITCKDHGDYEQLPYTHLKGNVGCSYCTGNINVAKTTKDFLREAQEVWGSRWDYGEVEYRSNNKKVRIVCIDHGVFEQSPSKHLAGQIGCSGCNGKKPSTSQFVKKSKEAWGDRWDYSKSNYINANTPVSIICREHGEFQQFPWNHYRGSVGCSKCSGVNVGVDIFLYDSKERWGDRWDYSLVEYVNKTTPVTIVCKDHGPFQHTPQQHLIRVGCPKCNGRFWTQEEFLRRSYTVWKDRWDYSDTIYTHIKDTITLICREHGEFTQPAETHLLGHVGCRDCVPSGTSNSEKEVFNTIQEYVPDLLHRHKVRLDGKIIEVDMFSPSNKIAVEFNGVYWHSSEFKKNSFHKDKYNRLKSEGIRLLQVWEDDWNLRRPIVEEHLKRVFGCSDQRRIGARSIEVREIEFSEASVFLTLNHIQGSVPASHYIGGFYDGELVALASFRKRGEDFELVRYATSMIVQGGHSKLVSFFERNYDYNNLITFADLTFSDGGLYRNTGWMEQETIPPDYRYLIRGVREHKFNYRIKRFREDPELKFEEGLTERELAHLNGMNRVYDAGKIKFTKPHP